MKTSILEHVKRFVRHWMGYPILHNVTGTSTLGRRRNALLVYLPKAFSPQNDNYLGHQNLLKCRLMARVLGELGFAVDVADYRDPAPRLGRLYDVVLSHNLANEAASWLTDGGRLVYFATGMEPREHNRRVRRRLRALEERRHVKVNDCVFHPESSGFLPDAHAVIAIGNRVTTETWKSSFDGPVHALNNIGFEVIKAPVREVESASKRFVYLGSRNHVRKGLDLVLETFADLRALSVFVCGLYDEEGEVCSVYRKELCETANIHPCGWVDVGTEKWDGLNRMCLFNILASCEEGQAGGIINGLFAGLIPVVTKETGVDAGEYGFVLPDDRVESIRDVVIHASTRPRPELEARSRRAIEVARALHSEQAFAREFRRIVEAVIGTDRKA